MKRFKTCDGVQQRIITLKKSKRKTPILSFLLSLPTFYTLAPKLIRVQTPKFTLKIIKPA